MAEGNKYICIHGHFYQPPRENAWLEVIEKQDEAAPFHDWNERINFECYAPNTAARIKDGDVIIKINNNYTQISFNFGPTLLSWMEHADPDAYMDILQADKLSQERFEHGSAIAQVYSHLIMPLANQKDKETQVTWGIKDFEHRFGRKPKGMWLAETAVDMDSLEALAKYGIEFTILAPRQAKAFRKIGEEHWSDLSNGGIDTKRPYLCKLPSGKSIALFFYDGNISQDVAFKGILNNGKDFAKRLTSAFDGREEPQLVHIATDGESYGHHHSYGEMALADCLNYLEETGLATITNYSEFLEKFPPQYEAQIHENSSWSCVHGVERWRSNCGCNTGGNGGWQQEWRKHLRDLLNWLRDKLIPIYEVEVAHLVQDPWEARNDYIDLILNRSEASIQAFLEKHAPVELVEKEVIKLFRLLEMQRNALLMFTSCAWFFDEISGLETTQVLQYALRAIYYAKEVTGLDLHPEFLNQLEKAPSNVYENGAVNYKKVVMPSRLDLERVGMHYAIASLFEDDLENLSLFNYTAKNKVFERIIAGNHRLVIGRAVIESKITCSKKTSSFAVLYLGQQNIIGNISTNMPNDRFQEMQVQLIKGFEATDLGKVIGLMQAYFGSETFSIWHLFRDVKRKIFQQITQKSLSQVEKNFRKIYNDNYQLMTGMQNSNIPIPDAYRSAVRHIINTDLHDFFTKDLLKISDLQHLSYELKKWNIEIDDPKLLSFVAGERLFYEIKKMDFTEIPLEQLSSIVKILEALNTMKLELDIWKTQNYYFSLLKKFRKGARTFPNKEWKNVFLRLGELLKVKVVFFEPSTVNAAS